MPNLVSVEVIATQIFEIRVNIQIMRAFVKLKELLLTHVEGLHTMIAGKGGHHHEEAEGE